MALTQVQGGMLAGSTNTTTTIQSNGTTAITIDSSQNVGIGTTSPLVTSANRKVVTLNGTTDAMYNIGINGTYTGFFYSSASNTQIGSATSIPLQFYTGDTERMRIDSSGSAFLATTNTAPSINNVYGIALNRDGNGNYAAGVVQFSANGSAAITLNRGSDDGQTMNFRRSGSSVGNIQVTTGGTSYNTSSDYRLKENIAPMTGALTKVATLKPCTYTWKADGKEGQGFIAHELQAVVPDAVSGEKDAIETYKDEDGNEQTRIKPQGVDTSFLVATLTAAIQELNAKVEAQAAEIAALKAAK